jgi:BirA family biotin operon repressor/biotin-[acetyl-CoA-carboxylase] ligase
MKLIKLGAIDSTNEFLKGLSHKQELDNFTVVMLKNKLKEGADGSMGG